MNLVSGRATDNATGVTDRLIGITEVAVAGSNDTLIADSGTDVLSVAGSGDTLIGGSATTTLVSNAGGNTLEAGRGLLWCRFGLDPTVVSPAAKSDFGPVFEQIGAMGTLLLTISAFGQKWRRPHEGSLRI